VGEEADAGTDTVQALIDYALGDNLENLLLLGSANLSGTGNGDDNDITGNGGENLLLGKGGKDDLFGEGGRDDLEGGNANDDL
jgi:Ca2+-binding RTX toxin-like protein